MLLLLYFQVRVQIWSKSNNRFQRYRISKRKQCSVEIMDSLLHTAPLSRWRYRAATILHVQIWQFLSYSIVRFSWFCFDFTHLSRPNRLANFLVALPTTLSKHFSFEWYKFCQRNFKELWLITSVNWYTFWYFLKILKSRLYNDR